jgi:hypothetical protein
MFQAYYRGKLYFSLAVAALVAIGIGGKELAWATSYVEVPATVVSYQQTCAGGSRGPGYIDCSVAFAGANRRTVLTLAYTSPADGQVHQASVRCDTSAEETPTYASGQLVEVLADKHEPGRIDRRKCTTIPEAA